MLLGGAGIDQIFGGSQIAIDQAIANSNTGSGNGLQGDWLSGNAGASNDNDNILGDADYSAQNFSWTVTLQADNTAMFSPASGELNPADSAGDVIYAGTGNDYAWAGAGDDIAFEEDGNDTLMGGAGDDAISGDASYVDASLHGADYIDGGDGNDIAQATDTEMAKTTNGAICAVLHWRAKPEAANDPMRLAAYICLYISRPSGIYELSWIDVSVTVRQYLIHSSLETSV